VLLMYNILSAIDRNTKTTLLKNITFICFL